MNRTWKSEGGYTLQLVVGERYARVTLIERKYPVFSRQYEWHEVGRAARDAEVLANLGHMQEVPSGLRERA